MAAAQGEIDPDSFLRRYPVSRQWFRILTERLDAVAVVYHLTALLADADSSGQSVRVDHYRQGPYDALVTLSQGRTLGIIRQGPMLPSPNLRYRLRTAENLPYREQPEATLVLACSGQANRRAVRTLGHPMAHRFHFVATEGEQLAGYVVRFEPAARGVEHRPFLPRRGEVTQGPLARPQGRRHSGGEGLSGRGVASAEGLAGMIL